MTLPIQNPTDALKEIERKEFVSSQLGNNISGRSIPASDIARRILEQINPGKTDSVLIVGSGSGYLAALFSTFSKQVTALEKNHSLIEISKDRLQKLGIENVNIVEDSAENTSAVKGKFDTILVIASKIKDKSWLLKLLSPYGDFLALETDRNGLDVLYRFERKDAKNFQKKQITLLDNSSSKSDILIDLNLFDESILQQAKINAKKNNSFLIDELSKLSNVDEQELFRSIAQNHDIEYGDMDELLKNANPEYFKACSRAFLDAKHLLPVYSIGKSMKIVTNDPDASLREMQTVFPKYKMQKVLVTTTDFYRIWSALELGKDSLTIEAVKNAKSEHDLLDKSLEKIDLHLVSLFEAMLLDAVAERASDIHLEKYSNRVRVRLRIDGDLEDLPHYRINEREIKGLINVIKLRSNLDISEKRLPQGGRSRLRVGKDLFDLRVQTQPSLYGENVVIRLLPQNSSLIDIDRLGLSPTMTKHYQRLLHNPSGMILVVGPTGSGKSTTLYAGLQVLSNDHTKKIITAEDPVEYSIDNIQQTPIRPEIDYHFHDAMRSFVREDPDIIFVGEIRDTETALEAIRASQTGHLLLSTLHCNDAVDSLQRLYDLDIKPNSIASELLAVIAQRLAKKICVHCKQESEPDKHLLDEIFSGKVPKNFKSYEGKGCIKCNGQGTYGRIAIVEFMPVTPELRDAISKKPSIVELRTIAENNGLISMKESALEHVCNGVIPLSELPRLIPLERLKSN